jgi:hypothetical protein
VPGRVACRMPNRTVLACGFSQRGSAKERASLQQDVGSHIPSPYKAIGHQSVEVATSATLQDILCPANDYHHTRCASSLHLHANIYRGEKRSAWKFRTVPRRGRELDSLKARSSARTAYEHISAVTEDCHDGWCYNPRSDGVKADAHAVADA